MHTIHEDTVASIISIMRAKLSEDSLTLERLAKDLHYSPFHLNRKFRARTGIPPRAFLSALRMEEAKKKLSIGDNTATEIGHEVGYSSFGTFSSRFTEYVGVPPSKFRECMEHCIARLRQYHEEKMRQAGESSNDSRGITGYVAVPADFRGFICAGLFPKPVPQGRPAACVLLFESGECWFPPVPDGTYYLLSAAFGWDSPEEELVFPRNNLRGIRKSPIRVENGKTSGTATVTLRPPRWYDPPMLISIPFLLLNFLEGYETIRKESAN